MGLDMYAYATKINEHRTELAYWRKFNHLHGWMERLYRMKGGSDEFNCTPVELTSDDLNALKTALKTPEVSLPHTMGFFFGGEDIYPEDIESTLKFIKDAKKFIKNGYSIYYTSWW